MAVAYPKLNVKIVGFMPGLSSPGGPSHQAIEDVALMRALPNMTVVDPADAIEITQAVAAIADHPGPVYLRLKRGEIPQIFDDDHRFDLGEGPGADRRRSERRLHRRRRHDDPGGARRGARARGKRRRRHRRQRAGDQAARRGHRSSRPRARAVSSSRRRITPSSAGWVPRSPRPWPKPAWRAPLRRVGIADVFAESGSREYLFSRYGLGTQNILDAAWRGLAINRPAPTRAGHRNHAGGLRAGVNGVKQIATV